MLEILKFVFTDIGTFFGTFLLMSLVGFILLGSMSIISDTIRDVFRFRR